jgi:hypothetical protein
VPQVLSYQGRLTDATGKPVADALYAVRFRLYAQPDGGTHFWEETQSVTTRSGMFSVLLGAATPITTGDGRPTTGAAYLGMAVEGDAEMMPRLRLAGTGVGNRESGVGSRGTGGVAGTDADDAWVRIGSDSVLYTIRRLGIVRGGSSNVLYGIYGYTQTIFGSSCTTGASGANVGNISIGGGYGNRAWAPFTAVCGGRNNKAGDAATDTSAIVVGGYGNKATAKFAYVAGGLSNTASGLCAAVGGGNGNAASGDYAAVSGGYLDTTGAPYGGALSGYSNLGGDATADTGACVAGGYDNSATAMCAFVGGGWQNASAHTYAAVGGGAGNSATGTCATVGGGSWNTAGNNNATVGGGCVNGANGWVSTVGGGYTNTASDTCASIGGGRWNRASGAYATVAGGIYDTASNVNATVGGGGKNTASGSYSTVAGGWDNRASGHWSTVGGGNLNTASSNWTTVAGGYTNTATAAYAAVGGGLLCDVAADYGFAVGGNSDVASGHDYSAAFNGTRTTASGQLRCGTLSKSGGSFTIDHPLDPNGKILNHYFTESPEMVNIYRGVVTLGASGRAAVSLPDYFSALNEKPMVQLTGVGTYEVYVVDKVVGNRFVIGGKPGTEVYWTVTGARKDQSAEIIKLTMPVEQPKTDELAGHSLDDDFLRSTKDQLDRMGVGGRFDFRTAAGRKLYEEMKNPTKNNGGEK